MPIERVRSAADRNLGAVAAMAVPAASAAEDFRKPRRSTDVLAEGMLMAGWLIRWMELG